MTRWNTRLEDAWGLRDIFGRPVNMAVGKDGSVILAMLDGNETVTLSLDAVSVTELVGLLKEIKPRTPTC